MISRRPRRRLPAFLTVVAAVLGASGGQGQTRNSGAPVAASITTITSAPVAIVGNTGVSATTVTVPPGLGSLQNVTVTFNGFSHSYPTDAYFSLAGPRGQSVSLMHPGSSVGVSNLTITFDDLGTVLGTGVLTSGTYRPAEPALTTFNGPDPGGEWRLTIALVIPGGSGTIGGGWSLTLTTSPFPQTFTFADDPPGPGVTPVKAAHVTELRTAISSLRARGGLSTFTFADPMLTEIRALHIAELRSALNAVFVGRGRVGPVYTDPTITAQTTVIKAKHVEDLRSAIREADLELLTVSKAGSGAGTVSSNPAGIECGADCTEPYLPGKVVTLTVAAAAGSAFGGWSGACMGTGACQVTMSAARAVTATFTPLPLTVAKSGAGSGTVTSVPAGIDCGADCSEGFAPGTAVTLYANPAVGSAFTGWSGACTGTGVCQLTVSGATQVTATFANYVPSTYDVQPLNYFMGVSGGCNGGVVGVQFTVTAPANVTWTVGWTGSDLPGSTGHVGGLNSAAGTGSGSVIFTVTVASQSPAPGRTCANIIEYEYADNFFFRFYDSNGTKVGEVFPRVTWIYRLVS